MMYLFNDVKIYLSGGTPKSKGIASILLWGKNKNGSRQGELSQRKLFCMRYLVYFVVKIIQKFCVKNWIL
jgi:hypothetical protein